MQRSHLAGFIHFAHAFSQFRHKNAFARPRARIYLSPRLQPRPRPLHTMLTPAALPAPDQASSPLPPTHPPMCVAGGVSELFAPGLDPVSFRTRAGRILRASVRCQLVSFVVYQPATRRLDIDFDPYRPDLPLALAGFARHMAAYPCFNCDPTVAGGRPFIRSDFLSDEEFYNAPVYLEGFKVAGISDHAAMLLSAIGGTVTFLGLEKCDGSVFTPAHRDRLAALQPHLVNAWLLARAFASLADALVTSPLLHQLGLTPRETDILLLLAIGKTNVEIAGALALAVTTVKSHVSSIFNKFGVDNRHAAILRAHELTRPAVSPVPPTMRRASAVAALEQMSACAPPRSAPFIPEAAARLRPAAAR